MKPTTEKRKSRELESINCQELNDQTLHENEKETFAMSKGNSVSILFHVSQPYVCAHLANKENSDADV